VIKKDAESKIRKFSELYVQLGLLEKLLRVAIPASLEESLANVRWLQEAMGLVKAE
jgi:hypothetical protein